MVTGSEQRQHRAIQPLLRAGKGQDIGAGKRVIGRGDGFAQCRRAPGLGIAERNAIPDLAIFQAGKGQKIGHGHGLGVARRHVVARLELPAREMGFEAEIRKRSHDGLSFWFWRRASAR
jgi:hypothetical protein